MNKIVQQLRDMRLWDEVEQIIIDAGADKIEELDARVKELEHRLGLSHIEAMEVEPLGDEFEGGLYDNLEELYETTTYAYMENTPCETKWCRGTYGIHNIHNNWDGTVTCPKCNNTVNSRREV